MWSCRKMYMNVIIKSLFAVLVFMHMAALCMDTSGDTNQDRIYCIDEKCSQLATCLKRIAQKERELKFIAADHNRYGVKTREIKEKADIELLKYQKEQVELIQFLSDDTSKEQVKVIQSLSSHAPKL